MAWTEILIIFFLLKKEEEILTECVYECDPYNSAGVYLIKFRFCSRQ